MRTQTGEFPRLCNPDLIPTKESIPHYIEGKESVDAWTTVIRFMDDGYNLDYHIVYHGKKYGWALQYKKGKKTIVTFYPERKAFNVLLIFGADELRKFDASKMDFSTATRDWVDHTEKRHDGKWMWIRLENSDLIDDIMSLIRIKRKPDIE